MWEAMTVCSFSSLWVGVGTWGSLETAHECISLSRVLQHPSGPGFYGNRLPAGSLPAGRKQAGRLGEKAWAAGGRLELQRWQGWVGESPGKLDRPLEMSNETLFPFDCVEVEVEEGPQPFL